MKNKEKLSHTDLVGKAAQLAFEIQNKGIATVFVNISGHVTQLSIKIHEPVWASGIPETLAFECYLDYGNAPKILGDIIKQLSKIAARPELDEETQVKITKAGVRKAKIEQLKRLKRELAEETV